MVTAWQEFEGRALRVNAGPPPPRREDSSFRGDSSFRVNRVGEVLVLPIVFMWVTLHGVLMI